MNENTKTEKVEKPPRRVEKGEAGKNGELSQR
jgi:hypothetical protein